MEIKTSSFEDKVVVITGGGGILCRVLAKAVAGLGAKIALLDLNVDAAMEVVDEIRGMGQKPQV